MRQSLFFTFIGVFITINVTSHALKINEYTSNLAWLFGINNKLNKIKEDKPTVCQTQECQKIAKVITQSMDKSVDPCSDFYEHACGKWPENNPLPKGKDRWNLFAILEKNILEKIQDILKVGLKDNDLLAVKLAKKWYMACMDIDAMEKQGLASLVSTLSRIGGWPMTMEPDEWNEQEYNWQKVDDQYMRLTGNNIFHDLSIYTYKDDSNQTKKLLNIHIPTLPPGALELLPESTSNSDENKTDEDSSDEEEQNDKGKVNNEWENSQEPQTEDKNNEDSDETMKNKKDNKNNDIYDENINEWNNEKQTKVRAKVFNHKKIKNSLQAKKKKEHAGFTGINHSYMGMKHRTKRQIIETIDDNKTPRKYIHREKLNSPKGKRNHLNKKNRKKINKIETAYTSTTPQFSTEETNDEIEAKLQSYMEYISKVARAIAEERGVSISEEQFDKNIKDMVDFQMKLTKIIQEPGEDINMTLDNFQTWYNNKKPKTFSGMINWIYKITELFDEANVPVDGSLEMTVGSPDYFEALVSLLDETPNQTIVNYIHWNFLSNMIKTTTNEMRELYNAWGKIKKKDRFSSCIKEIRMGDILSYEYVRKYFSDNITTTAMDIIDDIQKEVEYQIKESDWMDDDTKDRVLTKLINMKKLIGYPDWYRNSTIMKRYFQGLVIDVSYYENTLSYKRYTRWKELRQLIKDYDLETFWMDPITVNAMYAVNTIVIPASIFHSPLFNYNQPHSINYGIVGVIMAHEVNHGFDNIGHLQDKNGNFMEWLSTMAEAYGKRAECFVEQFNNYPIVEVDNKKLKNYGNQTIDDNIADTMGLQAAFRAYQRRERQCGKSNTALPGLEEYTNDQLFFLSFANLWCGIIDPVTAMKLVKDDEHSTGRLRVIGSVSNSEDFAKTYNCPINSPMNPPKKCNIWK